MKILLVIIFILKFSISYNQTFIPLNTDIVNISTYDKEEDGIYLGEPFLSPKINELSYDEESKFYKISGYIWELYAVGDTSKNMFTLLVYDKQFIHVNTDSLLLEKDSILVNSRLSGARYGYFTIYMKKNEIAEIVSKSSRFKGFISIKED